MLMKIIKIVVLGLLSLAWAYFVFWIGLTYWADEKLNTAAAVMAALTAFAFVGIFRQKIRNQ